MRARRIMMAIAVASICSALDSHTGYAQHGAPATHGPMVAPTFDVSGNWQISPGNVATLFQIGDEVTEIFNNGYNHLFVGHYISPTTIRGTVTRRSPTHCTTIMAVTLNVTSANTIVDQWIDLDGNCDLQRGQTGGGTQMTRLP